ncbi:alpha-L-fucosidase [Novosphingobium sp.]|uniref:alpha-L-fucosidase n=1 Tax=Novosphingobium sp. TaxID=1874826 RepID=UPI00261AC959|nr:alpha-L-fucosidase [Novosphingobium sp.]
MGSLLAGKAFAEERMDKMWGDMKTVSAQNDWETSPRAAILRDGNYGMFIHWGLYSSLEGKWDGTTFYGIGEWIKRQMKIPDAEYMALAKSFNPVDFDAKAVVSLAKRAGMRYIVITSKHHEGFAMFHSKHPFNIVDATPFKRDPMKELADECRAAGLGFGFYYSHFQDWTAPGGQGAPTVNPDGTPATFDQYFREKCYPQVEELCTNYGPLSFIWFDTPGDMPKHHIQALADLVRRTQPNALLNSRIGQGMGDFKSLGDMEVPLKNHPGLWETCDTTNDSWAYAWYDNNWKTPTEILHRTVATVGRGGAYLLNIGPNRTGKVPELAAQYLLRAGEWIKKNPDVIYNAAPSPWEMSLPWGDVTRQGNTLNLVVFKWPNDRVIYLSGLNGKVKSARLHQADGKTRRLPVSKAGDWTAIDAGAASTATLNDLAGRIELVMADGFTVDPTIGVSPNLPSLLHTEFAKVEGAAAEKLSWMEKFGEWKATYQVSKWSENGVVEWPVDVAAAGEYQVELIYKGTGRPVFSVITSEGAKLQNQQAASVVYHAYPFGVLGFSSPGKKTVRVALVEGDREKTSLQAIRLIPVVR